MEQAPLRAGVRYRFIYSIDNGRSHYATVARFIGTADKGRVLLLDLRPLAGTARLEGKWVTRVELVPADTPSMSNQRWRGRTQ